MLEEIGVLYRGLVLGFVIAAPVGPVGLLCIRRTIQKGMIIGLATGLGAAAGDALFGAIAVLGIGAITDFIHHYESSIRLIGGAIVMVSAWHAWHDTPGPSRPQEIVASALHLQRDNNNVGTSLRAVLNGFVITVTNPLTLFGTLAVVATFGAITAKIEADVMISGIFAGSGLWWLFLSGGVSLLRRHFSENRIILVNRFTAVMLALLAGWAIISGAHGYMR